MGPFFSVSNVAGSVSRRQIEAILEGLSPAQLDGIADIIYEAYGESVYDYLQVAPTSIDAAANGAGRLSSGAESSPFLAFMAPLDQADRTALHLGGSVYLDRLLRLRDGYLSSTASLKAGAAESSPTTALATATPFGRMGSEPAQVSATAWPNPASERLHVRVRGGQGAAVSVYDMRGRVVARMHVPEGAQDHILEWDLRAAGGRRVAAGVYQVVLTGEDGGRRFTRVTVL